MVLKGKYIHGILGMTSMYSNIPTVKFPIPAFYREIYGYQITDGKLNSLLKAFLCPLIIFVVRWSAFGFWDPVPAIDGVKLLAL